MKIKILITLTLAAGFALSGCDENELPAEQVRECSKEHLQGIKNEQERSDTAKKCMTGGSYKPLEPKTF